MARYIEIQTVHPPELYAGQQILNAYKIAWALNRGKFVLMEPPA